VTTSGSGTIGGSGNKTLLSGTQVIPHNADGTKTLSFGGSCQLGINWGGTQLGTISGTGSMTLTPIQRYATVNQNLSARTETTFTITWSANTVIDYIWYSTNNGSSWTGIDVADGSNGQYTISGLSANTTYQIQTRVRRKDNQMTSTSSALSVTTFAYPYANAMPNFTIGEKVTIGLYNPLNRTVQVSMLGADNSVIQTDTVSGTSISGWIIDAIVTKLYASIPNSKSGIYKVRVTYGTNISTKTGGTYSVNANVCAPSIGTVAYEDTNSQTVALTGNNQDIVQNKSTPSYTASGLTALNGATISSCSVLVNGTSTSLTVSGNNATGQGGVIDSGQDIEAVFTVTDSRGLTASKSVTLSMLDWTTPSAIVTLQRQDNFYTETDLTVDARFSSINGNNQITITYAGTKEGDSSATVTGTVQDNVTSVVNLDNNYAWTVEITLTDSLGATASYTAYISRGMPIIYFDRLKSSVGINCFPQNDKSLEINGKPLDDFIVEQGTSGIWSYQKYKSGIVTLDGSYEIDSSNITWNAYMSTGLVYGNTRIPYPFNITGAIINATLDYAGGSVGWVSTANALDNTQTSVTMVRNGQTGTMRVSLHVKGTLPSS
jgi:predicted outer membrane repeat protein